MVGEVDELEEDVGWTISCVASVIHVEEWELEEELVDKPGTTIGNEVLCVALYPNTVFNEDVVFDHWSIRKSIRVHRKAFRAMTAGVFLRTFNVKNISISLT